LTRGPFPRGHLTLVRDPELPQIPHDPTALGFVTTPPPLCYITLARPVVGGEFRGPMAEEEGMKKKMKEDPHLALCGRGGI